MLKWIILGLIGIALVSLVAVTLWVEREAPYRSEIVAKGEAGKALILYHPSRDAQFSDDLSLAMARGFGDAGMMVERRTMTSATPAKPEQVDAIAVVSNTFYFQPDWPTMRYLKRVDFKGIPVIAIMAGGGSTDRAQAKLTTALKAAGADLRGIRPLWTSRPNDPARLAEDNRKIAEEHARKFAFDLASKLIREKSSRTVKAPLSKADTPSAKSPAN